MNACSVFISLCFVIAGFTQGQLIDLDGGSIHVHREPHGVDRGPVGIGRGRGIGGFVDDIGRGRGRGGFVEDIGRGRGGLGGLLDNVIGGISQAIGGIGGGRRRRRPRICYRRGEIPAHDRYGNVEWCSDRYHYCQDPFAQCRLGRRGIYGTCCKSRHPVPVPYCRDGSPSAGYCRLASQCPHGGTHYECERSRRYGSGVGIGIGSRRGGICCAIRHK